MTSRLRVMTFNVRYDTPDDGEHAWDHRKDLVASVIRRHRPDVVGLQEPLPHQLAFLREALPAYRFVGAGRVDGDAEGEHCPLGYRHERLSLEEWGTEWLSETPKTPGTSYPGAKKPRIATWGRFAVDESTLLVCNTHFDHESADARYRSAGQVRRLVESRRHGESAALLGDFNCMPDSRPYRRLVGDASAATNTNARARGSADADDAEASLDAPSLVDAMVVSRRPHRGPTVTFECFDGEPDRKIDHVFVRGVDVVQHAVPTDHRDGPPPSDHLPVLAELEL